MHRLNDLVEKLTPQQIKEVEDFAEFLATRRRESSVTPVRPKYIDVDGLIGLCAGMGGDKSDKELIREAWDEVVDKYDK
jgi:hypothetical protein